MKGLTENQKQIIKDLKEEFLDINKEEETHEFSLLDINEVNADVAAQQKFEREVKAYNEAFRKKSKQLILKDFKQLKSDLAKLGINSNMRGDFTIEIDGYAKDINYDITDKSVDGPITNKYKSNRCVIRNSYGNTFDTIEIYIERSSFKQNIKSWLNNLANNQ
jgi:hypothetical protein